MRKAIIIVPSKAELSRRAEKDLLESAATILDRTIIVRTPECVGEAVVIAGTIITSLFLVGNHTMVNIITAGCGSMQAAVGDRDEENYVAKLVPASLDPAESRAVVNGTGNGMAPARHPRILTGPVGSIGDPLFMTKARKRTPTIIVSGMSYRMHVCERREFEPGMWRIDRDFSRGKAGSGVWTIDGNFVGVALAHKAPFENNRGSLARERLFVLPAQAVMDFAETK